MSKRQKAKRSKRFVPPPVNPRSKGSDGLGDWPVPGAVPPPGPSSKPQFGPQSVHSKRREKRS